jgi:predicted RND superfamily exporter protein
VNIYVRYLEARETGGPTLPRSTVLAVVLNGLTTVAGFGSLMKREPLGPRPRLTQAG